MGTQDETVSDLRGLDDPAFFKRWSEVRLHYALTPPSDPRHSICKRDYAAVIAEYKRRLNGR
jgi:hypothetical protein